MNSAYILKITTQSNYIKVLDKIFNYSSNSKGSVWEFCIEEGSILFENALLYFLELLESKCDDLSQIKIEDISIWYLYEYYGQCNIEFQPNILKRMSNLNITICISCWEGKEFLAKSGGAQIVNDN